MKRALINAIDPEEIRVAFVQGNTLYDLDIENLGQQQKVGNIYKGKIYKIHKDINGMFVDYGTDRHGFLSLIRVSAGQLISAAGEELALDDLKEGQDIMVQVGKDERGSKGVQLLASIVLPSRYLSITPNNPNPRDQVPERLLAEAKNAKSQLDIPKGMGVSITKEGLDVDPEALRSEFKLQLDHWNRIKAAGISKDFPTPCLLHQSERSPIRVLRDYLTEPVDEIVVDERKTFQIVKNYVDWCVPDHVGKVILHEENWPLFNYYKISDEIHKSFDQTVRLPSGGTIVIDPTEALIAIDVNTARAKGRSARETALKTNLEAVTEVARQLRIRDLSGLIVIDLIGMSQKEDEEDAEKIYLKLCNALRQDRATTRVTEVSKFGLIEIERQRLRISLHETLSRTCPLCQGQSLVPNVNNQALRILRQIIEERALSDKVSRIEASTSSAIATYLLNEKRHAIREIELERNVVIIINPDESLLDSQFEIREFDDRDAKIRTSTDQTSLTKSRSQKNKIKFGEKIKPAVPLSTRGARKTRIGDLVRGFFGLATSTEKKLANKSKKAHGHGLSRSKKHQSPRRSGRGRGGAKHNRPSGNQEQLGRSQGALPAKSDSTVKTNERQMKGRGKPAQSRNVENRDENSNAKIDKPKIAVNTSKALNDPRIENTPKSPTKVSKKQPGTPRVAVRRTMQETPKLTPQAQKPEVDKGKLVARNDPRSSNENS